MPVDITPLRRVPTSSISNRPEGSDLEITGRPPSPGPRPGAGDPSTSPLKPLRRNSSGLGAAMAPRGASAANLRAASPTRATEAATAQPPARRPSEAAVLADFDITKQPEEVFASILDSLVGQNKTPTRIASLTPKEKGEAIKTLLGTRMLAAPGGGMEPGNERKIATIPYAEGGFRTVSGQYPSELCMHYAPLMRATLLGINEQVLGDDKADLSDIESGKAYRDLTEAVKCGMPYDKARAAFPAASEKEQEAVLSQAGRTGTALRAAGPQFTTEAVMDLMGLPQSARPKVAYETATLAAFASSYQASSNVREVLRGLAGEHGVDNDFSRMTPSEKASSIKLMLGTRIARDGGNLAPNPDGKFLTSNPGMDVHGPLLRQELLKLNESLGPDKADLSDVTSGRIFKNTKEAVDAAMPYLDACKAFGVQEDKAALELATNMAYAVRARTSKTPDECMKLMGLPESARATMEEKPYVPNPWA